MYDLSIEAERFNQKRLKLIYMNLQIWKNNYIFFIYYRRQIFKTCYDFLTWKL